VPAIYKGVVTTCLDCPREGVDVVVTTDTHLVEFHKGLVLRSCRLGVGEKFSRIRVLLGQMVREWFYVLEGGGKVVILKGENLKVAKEYSDVEEVDYDDFLNIGKRMVKVRQADGDVILTDGETEYDPDQELLVDQDDGTEGSVNNVLEQRLTITREAVIRAKADLEMTSKLVEESMKELMISCGIDEVVECRNVGKLLNGEVEEKEKKGLAVTGHFVRLLRGELLIGLELETVGGCGEVSEVELQLVADTGEVEYKYYLLRIAKRRENIFVENVSGLGVEGVCVKGTMVAKVPFTSINPSTTINLMASVSYILLPSSRRLHTKTTNITLNPQDFCSNALSPSFESSMAIPSFFSVFLTGIRETLSISTELGSLQPLPSLLSKLNFTLTNSIGGYLLDSPSNPLYLSMVMLSPVNSRQMEAIMYAKDYTHLTLLVRMLREIVPADAQFQRVEVEEGFL